MCIVGQGILGIMPESLVRGFLARGFLALGLGY